MLTMPVSAGSRLQKSDAKLDLNQEGTHSPDTDHRWMAAAMDGSGNLG
ncbi:MAG: hypothetical protein IPK53_07740 [bacterium]|nr:hypothetical protein [bacterium]